MKKTATVADRGQVTIPKILRRRLGIVPGTVLEFREERGRLIAVRAQPHDPVGDAYGCLGTGKRTDPFINALRGARNK